MGVHKNRRKEGPAALKDTDAALNTNEPVEVAMPTKSFNWLLAAALGMGLSLSMPSLARAEFTVSEEPDPGFLALENELEPSLEPFGVEDNIQINPQVINGSVVDSRYFPAIFGKIRPGESVPSCTAALVGPSTMLIAAHCVDDNPNIRLRNGLASVRGRCVLSPAWRSNADTGVDVALCVLEHKITGISYESISYTLPNIGQDVYVTGFGCTWEGGPSDGKLRIGRAPAANRPSNFPQSPGTLYTASAIQAGQAVLCPGDSGGPLFMFSGTLDGPRRIIAVNSATTFSAGVSLYAALAAPANINFIQQFAAKYNQQICGVNLQLGCRG